MKNCEIFAQITWTRQDIRQLLEDHDLDNMEEAVDRFLERLDLRRFEEAGIEDGWSDCPGLCSGKVVTIQIHLKHGVFFLIFTNKLS